MFGQSLLKHYSMSTVAWKVFHEFGVEADVYTFDEKIADALLTENVELAKERILID